MDPRWIWAGVSIAVGTSLGWILGALLRRALARDDRRPALREIAAPLSIFAFWVLTATGIVLAVAVSSPETLRPIPRDILDWLPNVALAGLFVIGGYALGMTLAAGLGRAISRASGVRQFGVERVTRVTVFGGSIILALTQLGVDTTVLNILIAASVGGIAAALAGLSIIGSRSVAAHVAAGRVLQSSIVKGSRIRVGEIEGVVLESRVAHLLIETASGRVLVPYGGIIDQPIHLLDDKSSE